MNNNYQVVPNIITGKDLDYLSDMFEWNYAALKKAKNSLNDVNSNELKNLLSESSELFQNNINKILNTLSEGGSNE